MSENTKIEWADHTFNPWEGCQKVSPGCDNCYAEARNARFAGGTAPNWGPGAPRRPTSRDNWRKPLAWQRGAAAFMAAHGRRQRVFCASLADVMDKAAPDEWRSDLANTIIATPDLEWLLLTKRIANAMKMLRAMFPAGVPANVRLGITVVNQEEADRDIPRAIATRIVLDIQGLFLSIEPMLGFITLRPDTHPAWLSHIDQVIAGGESGPKARMPERSWFRSLRDECAASGVAFFFKQWGEWFPFGEIDAAGNHNTVSKGKRPGLWCESDYDSGFMVRLGKAAAGRHLDGIEHNGMPA